MSEDLLGVGDEVICVDDSLPKGWSAEDYPQWVQKDAKYTIREILDNDDIVIGVLLVELRNPVVYIKLIGRKQEGAFASWRFRKLKSAYAINEEKSYNKVKESLGVDI